MKKRIVLILCLIFFFSLFQKIMHTQEVKNTVQSYEQLEETMIIKTKKVEVKEIENTFDYPIMEKKQQG